MMAVVVDVARKQNVKSGTSLSADDVVGIIGGKNLKYKKARKGYDSQCPRHLGKRYNLHIEDGDDGKLLLTCHRGCTFVELIETLCGNTPKLTDVEVSTDWACLIKHQSSKMTPALYQEFAKRLDLPVDAITAVTPIGHDEEVDVFTYPEVDARGNILGIGNRYKSGFKGFEQGGKRGLYVFPGALNRSGPLFAVEGFSGTTAFYHGGVAAIGRPNNTGGAQLLAELFANIPANRDIIIVGDNDQDEEGECPGYKGAKSVAEKVAALLNRPIHYTLPPEEVKDCKDYLTAGHWESTPWEERGAKLSALLIESSRNSVAMPPDGLLSSGEAGPKAARKPKSKAQIIERQLRLVAKEVIDWLWPKHLPRSAVTIFEGDPGLGKSFLTLDVAARTSRGWAMPPAERGIQAGEPGHVILISAEDSLEKTIKPRLIALGADENNITCIETVQENPDDESSVRPIVLPDDLPLLEDAIARHNAKLVVVDPFSAVLTGKVDSNKDTDIRRVMHQLKLVAERTGTAILIVRHLNKMTSEGNAMYRGGGSIGIIGAARSAFVVGSHPDDESGERRVLVRVKGNLCAAPPALEYRIEVQESVPVVHWEGEVDITAQELSAKTIGNRDEKKAKAKEFLAEKLAGGPVAADVIENQAKLLGINKSTLRRAKSELGVSSNKSTMSGCWFWSLSA